MKEFSITDLSKKRGDVLAAASQEPVTITRYGKPRFIILSTEAFAQMQIPKDPRLARRTADIPADEGAVLEAELTNIILSDE